MKERLEGAGLIEMKADKQALQYRLMSSVTDCFNENNSAM